MKKRGQVTIFIIIAILIIGLISFYFIFREKIGLGNETNFDEKKMNELIENCILKELVDGARLIGLQGGYLEIPKKSVKLNSSKVAYGYYLGSVTLSPRDIIKDEISKYIELTLPYCIDEDEFPEYSITKGNFKSSVNINQNSISASTKVLIGATKKEGSFTMDKTLTIDAPIKLKEIYEVAEEIIKKELENPNLIDLSYLSGLDFEVFILPYDDKTIIYSITDKNKENLDYHYTFRFANKLR